MSCKMSDFFLHEEHSKENLSLEGHSKGTRGAFGHSGTRALEALYLPGSFRKYKKKDCCTKKMFSGMQILYTKMMVSGMTTTLISWQVLDDFKNSWEGTCYLLDEKQPSHKRILVICLIILFHTIVSLTVTIMPQKIPMC